jgi:integrase
MTRLRLSYIHAFRDRHGKIRHYFRRSGKRVPLSGLPGSDEFMTAYQAALTGLTIRKKQIGEERTVPGTLQALIAAYLDCSPESTSPFKALAAETQRTRRNILENLREIHGDKRVYRTDQYGRRIPLLTRVHVQRIINQKSNAPFAQRNLLNTLRAMFRWAVAEDRVPDDPTLGVNRQKIESAGYTTWAEDHIEQYRRRHALGTMPRLAIELILATAVRRGDAVKLGPQHVCGGTITFEQSKRRGRGGAPLNIPLHPDFCAALKAMPPSNVVHLTPATTFLTTSFGQPFKTAASFGNWFRQCCDQASLPKGISAHGLRKATARRLAELGCSTHQIAAITGHATLSEVQRYTKAADQKRLAQEAMKRLIEDRS